MTREPATFGELRECALEQSEAGDHDTARHYAHWMLEEAERSGDDGQYAAAYFTIANVEVAAADLERAEQAFTQALEFGRSVHGSNHPAVADALRSLGLVQRQIGDARLLDAAGAFKKASEIYAEVKPELACEAMTWRGTALREAGELTEALEAFGRAVELGDRAGQNQSANTLLALNLEGSCHRELDAHGPAFGSHARVTRRKPERTSAEVAHQLSRAWLWMARHSRVWGHDVQAAFAFTAARQYGDVEIQTLARDGLLALEPLPFDPLDELWRVTFLDGTVPVIHVAHLRRGLWTLKEEAPLSVGKAVDVSFDGATGAIASVRSHTEQSYEACKSAGD